MEKLQLLSTYYIYHDTLQIYTVVENYNKNHEPKNHKSKNDESKKQELENQGPKNTKVKNAFRCRVCRVSVVFHFIIILLNLN